MFLNIESIERKKTAIHDDSGTQLTYGELCDFISEMEALQLPRSIVFCLCENTAEYLRELPRLKASGLFRCC